VSYFNYELPEHCIAQRHASYTGRREDSRLLHLSWDANSFLLKDRLFEEVLDIFQEGDLLVLNNTRVLHARFFCTDDAHRNAEVLLTERDSLGPHVWKALARPMRKFKQGARVSLSSRLQAEVLGRTDDQRFLLLELLVKEEAGSDHLSIEQLIEEEGHIPIPPYIREGVSDTDDKLQYQTTFARDPGSVAAPTAGLHFSESVLSRIREKGVRIGFVTLHVGPGSFLPVSDVDSHEVFEERFFVNKSLWNDVLHTRSRKGRIIAVGTTVLRALETLGRAEDTGELLSKWCTTSLFIRPGFDFTVVDVLCTNFHQPSSTHLMLVEAFIGAEAIKAVYSHALNNNYRFLSYGDTSCLERYPDE
jgi:S-adenosylmethionine:tRNA ribosyltransferase-isomerase